MSEWHCRRGDEYITLALHCSLDSQFPTVCRSLSPRLRGSAWLNSILTMAITRVLRSSCVTSVTCMLRRSMVVGSTPSMLNFYTVPCSHTFDCRHAMAVDSHRENATLYSPVVRMCFLLEWMMSLQVSVLVLGIGIIRSQSIGYWVLSLVSF